MCNEAARLRSLGEISADINQLKIPLRFPEGLPNLGLAPSIRITDTTVIVRAAAELVMRRWSWPGSGGKPVYNFRSEGRRFDAGRDSATGAPGEAYFGRCLIPLDAFFEFTDPGTAAAESPLSLPLHEQRAPPSPQREGAGRLRAAKARKDKWEFTAADGRLLCVTGLWRRGVVPPMGTDGAGVPPHGGEAFTMLTCAPGPDIAPYHSRQIVLMPRDR